MEQSLTEQVNNHAALFGNGSGHNQGAENWTTKLEIYCSDYSLKRKIN